jgi:hypothetical protein
MVIDGIWNGLEHMGVGKGGVELDSITARITKELYPDSSIFAKGFEETPSSRQLF